MSNPTYIYKYVCTFNRLRSEEVVLLTLDLGNELLNAVDDGGQVLKYESTRRVRITGMEGCDIVAFAASDVDQQRGLGIGAGALEQDITDVEEVEPLLAVGALAAHEGVEVAHHRRVLDQPRKHVVGRAVRVLEGPRRPVDVGEPRLFEVERHVGQGPRRGGIPDDKNISVFISTAGWGELHMNR